MTAVLLTVHNRYAEEIPRKRVVPNLPGYKYEDYTEVIPHDDLWVAHREEMYDGDTSWVMIGPSAPFRIRNQHDIVGLRKLLREIEKNYAAIETIKENQTA